MEICLVSLGRYSDRYDGEMSKMFGEDSLLPHVKDKETKIFRPWDNQGAQDCTISTTTTTTDESEKKVGKLKEKALEEDHKPKAMKLNHHQQTHEMKPTEISLSDCPILFDSSATYPDLFHANLAHSLGLAPNDPLFLESISQGYAFEEYARVLSQEHQSKSLNRKQRPKKYKCPHCNVGFSNNGQLKGHIRIHTGERPFKCDVKDCGKTFTRNEELTRHKRIHSGLRPFPCNQCGKRFGRKDHLKKHTRTHMQPRGLYAVPVMLPYEAWNSAAAYPYIPMYGF